MSAADPLAWRLDAALREVPVDPQAFAQAVDRRVEEIAAARSQPKRLLEMLGEAAPLLRIAGRLEEARRTASAAIAVAELLEDDRAAFINRLALAAVMHWERRFELSNPLYDQLIAQVRGTPALADLADEVLQQAGKNLLQQRHYGEAARCFRDALKLRRAKGDDASMEASAEALRVTQAAQRAAGLPR